MGNRSIKILAVGGLIALTALNINPGIVYAAEPPALIPIFNGWSFEDWFPGMQVQAAEAYAALAPVGYLVMGGLLAGYFLDTLVSIVWAARRGPDED